MVSETESPGDDRFEVVDWESIDDGTILPTTKVLVQFGVFGLLAIAFLIDWVLIGDRVPFVSFTWYQWDISELDWLFMFTLCFLFFYLVMPLYRNQRMTMYYWRQFKKNKPAVVSLVFLLGVFFIGTFGPLVIDPPDLNVIAAYQPPLGTTVSNTIPVQCVGKVVAGKCHATLAHPLGTTGQGKDILKLVIFGMRVSMQIGLITTLLIILIGTTVGTISAYFGGFVDEALMRYVDIQLTFPTFFLYLLLVYLFGGSLFLLIIIFGLTSWGGIARLVRSEALQRREEEYIDAAISAGTSEFSIILRHIVPNVTNTIITAATLAIPGLILAEAALSFIGLGDPTIPSWGQVIATGRGDLSTAWWVSTIPGIFLFLTILGFNFIGDALRDALDPRLEH